MGIHTIFIDDDRWYENDETSERVPGVSAIVKMWPKDKLVSSAAKEAAFFVVRNIDTVASLAESNPTKAIEQIKTAYSRDWKRKAEKGTEVHTYTEQIARAVLAGTKPKGSVPKDVIPYLKHYARFYKEFGVEPVLVETVVWDRDVGFAGRLDMAARLRAIDDDVCIIDTKTGASGVWESTALQQTAYSYAEYYFDEASGKLRPMPETTRAYALWLRPEGYALIPLSTSEAEWRQFKALRQSLEWKRTRSKYVVHPAINKKPIKRQWKP